MKIKSFGTGIRFTLLLIFIFNCADTFSQNFFGKPLQHQHDEKCGAVYMEKLQEEKLGIHGSKEYFESWMKENIEDRKNRPQAIQRQQNDVRVIPVVVHVIHNGTNIGQGANIPLSQIEAQIRILNEDFRRLNPDANQTAAEFLPVAADSNIEFVLAKQDVRGFPTDGINRILGPKTTYGTSDLLSIGQIALWPPEEYLNIWVLPFTSPIIGVASPPITNLPGWNVNPWPREIDGIWVDYRYFGEGGSAVSGSTGRTATHEIGHFFGLRHIWGDGGCEVDDFVEDTPLQAGSNSVCRINNPRFTCESRDMNENYMDYTVDACMNIFTLGQVERMNVVLEESPRRASLVNNRATIVPIFQPNDLAFERAIDPQNFICSLTFSPQFELLNAGNNRITSARIEIKNNESVLQSRTFNFDIGSGETTMVTFDPITLNPNGNNFEATIILVNGTTDPNPSNNTFTSTPVIQPSLTLPYSLDFDTFTQTWEIQNPDEEFTWEETEVLIDGIPEKTIFIRNYEYEGLGEQDFLVSPQFDLSQVSNAQLTFNMAHGPYDAQGFGDFLVIAVSTDCGNTFEISEASYDKNVDFLQTTASTLDEFIPSSSNQFRREIVNLSKYAGLSNVRLAFIAINGYGNNIYLKDIEILTQEEYRYDAIMTELVTPGPIANNKHENENISLTNTGNLPITGFAFNRIINGISQSFLARGTALQPGETTNISLPKSTNPGLNRLEFNLLYPSFDQNERAPISLRRFVVIDSEIILAPWRQNFNNMTSLSPWISLNPENNLNSWVLSATQTGDTGSSVAKIEPIVINNSFWLGSPIFDLTGSSQASVFFDRAAGTMSENAVFKVMASSDGGSSYQEVYRATGTEITTVQSPVANPNNNDEFVRDYINLTAYAGANKSMIRLAFVFENDDLGNGPVFLDNLELFLSANDQPVDPGLGNTTIFPNPTDDLFNIVFNFDEFETVNIQIFSPTGALVQNVDYPNTLNQTYTFTSRQFSKGLFIIKITSRSITETRKLFIR
ncbi:zinc-dependent metalloprotease [Aquiflexum lacus]|uniref:zinc-dependent metalloprotease n=1 Tax=Aquiflexum lacus TaxID=2483805 RepID=UPI001895EF2E|nr:M43 family zinc metalloprotease [Aquiflexum lacus]